jgi:hypothetical protein
LLPPGALIAVVSGDPTGPGQSTIELSMPDGYGMGDRLDAKKTLPLTVGDTVVAPAGVHHYSVAKGTTVVAVTFMGPYTITYVNVYEAPRQRVFPYGLSARFPAPGGARNGNRAAR